MFEYPQFDPVAFALGPLQVRWYGLMYLLGFLLAWLGLHSRARRGGGPVAAAAVSDLVFYVAVGIIVGGRLGYMLFYGFAGLVDNPLSVLRVWEGGMSFHGGLIGVIVALVLFARKAGRPVGAVADFVAPWVAPGLGLGRLGNFINGELWGARASPDAFYAVWVNGVPRHPSQLYEALLEGLVLFAVLWWYSRRPRPMLAVTGAFLCLYGVFRVAVEFVRLPDVHMNPAANGYLAFDWLTMGQVLSAPMIAAGAIMFALAYRMNRFAERNPG